jgi:hypothetical protein
MTKREHEKTQPRHLKRNAYLYVRQFSMRQVFQNTRVFRSLQLRKNTSRARFQYLLDKSAHHYCLIRVRGDIFPWVPHL